MELREPRYKEVFAYYRVPVKCGSSVVPLSSRNLNHKCLHISCDSLLSADLAEGIEDQNGKCTISIVAGFMPFIKNR